MIPGKVSRLFLPLVCSLLLPVASLARPSGEGQATTPSAARRPQIVQPIDESQRIVLGGNTPPAARPQNDRGPVALDLPMKDMVLVLKRSPEQQAEFDAFVNSQYDPASPNFHKWLQPDQVGEKYGPSPADIETVTNWLQNHNFTVSAVSKNHMTIRFSGTARDVQAAFHTEIHNLVVKGVNHISNMKDPELPAALAPVVVGVQSLHDFFPKPLHRVGSFVQRDEEKGGWKRIETPQSSSISSYPRPEFGTTGGSGSNTFPIEDVSPYDFAKIYNVLPLWNASTPTDGTGQTLAIVGRIDVNLADVASFRSNFGLPVVGSSNPTYKAPTVIYTDPANKPTTCPNVFASNSSCAGDQLENTLDIEWSGAVAKNAQILFVTTASSTTTDGAYLSEQYVIDHNTAKVMSASYGVCELILGTSGNAAYNTLWQSAASEGIAAFVATGDSGSPSCDGNTSTGAPYPAEYGLSVSGVASSPWDTAVGGTDFNWLNNQSTYWGTTNAANGSNVLGYVPEIPWNNTCANTVIDGLLAGYLKSSYNYTGTNTEIICNLLATDPNYSGLVDVVGTGGGKSNCTVNSTTSTSNTIDPASCSGGYAKPSWQTGVTGIPGDGKRDIPDVSFFGSNGELSSAYLVCITQAGTGCTYSSTTEPGALLEVGGTSVGTPAMAGVMALINQSAGSSQGNPNAALYKLAAQQTYSSCSAESVSASSTSCYFNDIDISSNATPCDEGFNVLSSPDCTVSQSIGGVKDTIGILNGYDAVTGYDLATGLGSLNVANVVKSFASVAAPAVTFTPSSLTFASTTVGLTAGTQTVTLTNTGTADLTITGITVAGANASSFAETNTCGATLGASAKCVITVIFQPAAFGSLTASISVADNASNSPQTVALTGAGAETGSYSLSATNVSVSVGSTGASTITATGINGYNGGPITLNSCTLTSSPSGAVSVPTCSLTTGTISLSANGTGTGSVTIDTFSATTGALRPAAQKPVRRAGLWISSGGVVLSVLFLFGLPTRRRKLASFLGVALFMVSFAGLYGCGGGGTIKQVLSPTVTTGPASSVTNTAATIAATVNPNGSSTTATFAYGTSSTLAGATTTTAQSVGAGSTGTAISANLTALTAGTKYYFQANATNTGGSASGSIASFTTGAPATTSGAYTFTVTGTDAAGVMQSATFTVTVS